MTDKNRIRGKKAKASGARFELKVRADLESKGWVCDRWSNNIELFKLGEKLLSLSEEDHKFLMNKGKLIKAKSFMGRSRTNGFPDFIAFRKEGEINQCKLWLDDGLQNTKIVWNLIGVECKSNGYLDKIEIAKCRWLLENNIFSKILIASKGTKRGQIVYKEFNQNI